MVALERHNNTFYVNGTSAGPLPFDLQWASNFGGDQVSFGADPSEQVILWLTVSRLLDWKGIASPP